MDWKKLIEQAQRRLLALQAERETHVTEQRGIIDGVAADAALTESQRSRITELTAAKRTLTDQIDAVTAEIDGYKREQADDERLTRAAAEHTPTGARTPAGVVTGEARTYNEHNDKRGRQFALDVARQFLYNDQNANERLARHMQEERVERGGEIIERAAGTGNFSGMVVPQYLTDQFAPIARAGRPTADTMRHHDLPETGMTAYIPRATTGTTVDNQVNEYDDVAEQDYDDTLLEVKIQTAAGSQSLSRQAVDRGVGVDDTIVEDLFAAYGVNLDKKVLNQAGTGLTNVANPIAYTDGTPTAMELYPKMLAGPAGVEAALLNTVVGDTIGVMHSRRWYWLQSQLTSVWPLFGQQGIPAQNAGVAYAEKYGSGFRGVLPSGVPVIVDNNIATNYGAGTNEDELYFFNQSEGHLWEDPDAPMLIRADQPKAKKLAVDLVVYGYFAYTWARRPHAQKIAGTGLVTPTF
jgi:hypothetical protein